MIEDTNTEASLSLFHQWRLLPMPQNRPAQTRTSSFLELKRIRDAEAQPPSETEYKRAKNELFIYDIKPSQFRLPREVLTMERKKPWPLGVDVARRVASFAWNPCMEGRGITNWQGAYDDNTG